MNCTVVEVNTQDAVVEDTTGNFWAFYGNSYTVGDEIIVTYYGNGTDNIR